MASPAVRVVAHPDYLRLEEELARRIRDLQEGASSFPSVLVVAPTRRQVLNLKESLAARLGATTGVEILHHQALVYRISNTDPTAPRLASDSLISALIDELLRRQRPETDLARYALGRPGAVDALRRLFVELREAGLRARDLTGLPDSPGTRELIALFAVFESALSDGDDHADRPGLARHAIRRVADIEPFDAVFSYGAYDLVGVNLDLLEAVPSAQGLTFLVPMDPAAPAWAYAQAFAGRHLGTAPEVLPDPEPPRPFVTAARAVRDRKRGAVGDTGGRITLAHAQGPEGELNFVTRRALELIDRGAAPHRIGIVARTVEPYAAVAETIFERHGLRVDSSLTLPLTRFPVPQTFLVLLRALALDFERQPVIELARSALLVRPAEDKDRWWPGAWDQWSRSFGVIRGTRAWTEELPRLIREKAPPPWVEPGSEEQRRFEEKVSAQTESIDALARLVGRWSADAAEWRTLRSGPEHAAFLRRLGEKWIRGWGKDDASDAAGSQVQRAVEGVLDQVGEIGWVARRAAAVDGRPAEETFTVDEILELVEATLDSATIPWQNPDGVHFLDFMQARGLLFDHLFLIGFNERIIPRRAYEDPFLPDRVRKEIVSRTGSRLEVSDGGRDEEWLLFAQTLAAARETLTVTWQRADAEGKALSPSLLYRELRRIFPASSPALDLFESSNEMEPVRIPTHPGDAARWFADTTGLLTREEAALLACEHAPGAAPAALEGFLGRVDPGRVPAIAPGLRLIQDTEAWSGGSLAFDGVIPGGIRWTRPFSQTSLKALGTCPLTFFFRYVLGIEPLAEEAKEFRFEARELGSRMHAVLERVFAVLRDRGLMDGTAGADRQIEAARAAVDAHWNEVLDPLARRIGDRFPLLYRHAATFWRKEILEFLERDLTRLAEGGHRLESLEDPWSEAIEIPDVALESVRDELGPGVPDRLMVRGIPDRVTRDRDGVWLISDYKTAGRIENDVKPAEYLKGRRVQVPLYMLMAERRAGGAAIDAELLGLGPVFAPGGSVTPKRTATLDGGEFAETRTGFQETLAVLAGSATVGRFPFRSDFHCRWCDFQSACRRTHYPSRARVEEGSLFEAYFRTQKKGKKKQLLADIPPDEEGSGR